MPCAGSNAKSILKLARLHLSHFVVAIFLMWRKILETEIWHTRYLLSIIDARNYADIGLLGHA